MGIKVVATARGVHGAFREPGDQFEISHAREFAPEWMECEQSKDAEKIETYRKGVAKEESERAEQLRKDRQPVIHPFKQATADKGKPQTTGNNPVGAQAPDPARDTDLT